MAKRIIIIFALAAMIMLIAAGSLILQGNFSSEVSQNYDAESTVYSTNVIISEVLI